MVRRTARITNLLTGNAFDATDTIRCEVTPFDNFDGGLAVSSSTVTIQNSTPSVASASLTPNPAFTNTSVTVVPPAGTTPMVTPKPIFTHGMSTVRWSRVQRPTL